MTRKISLKTILIATLLIGILTFLSLIGAAAVDEGTEGTGGLGFIAKIFSKLFYIFRFPTHTFFFEYMNGSKFFIGLFANCIINGLLTERIISLYKGQSKKN